jgi:hypothetical protein
MLPEMKRAVKVALYAVMLMFLASLFGYQATQGRYLSSRQYMQDVMSKGILEQLSKSLSAQYAKELGPDFDSIRFQVEMENCLRGRIGVWLNGNDPRLNHNITKDGAKDLAEEFTSACLNDLSNGIR